METADCPTALLVDLAVPITTPRTPKRQGRYFKTPRTPKENTDKKPKSAKKQNGVREKDALLSVENTETPHTRAEKTAAESLGKEPREISRRDPVSTPEMSEANCFLDEEKFDFDLSLSPESRSHKEKNDSSHLSAREHEEEIFFGPVGHKERCIAKSVEADCPSQLTATEIVHIFKEANTVAFHLRARGTPMKTTTGKSSLRSSQAELDSPKSFRNLCDSLVLPERSSLHGTKRKLNIGDAECDVPSPKVQVKETKSVCEKPGTSVCEKPRTSARRVLMEPQRCPSNPGGDKKVTPLQRANSMRLPNRRPVHASTKHPTSITTDGAANSSSRLHEPGTRTRHLSISSNRDSSFSSNCSKDGSPQFGNTKPHGLNSSLNLPRKRSLPQPAVSKLATARGGVGIPTTRPVLPSTRPGQAGNAPEKSNPEPSGLTRKPSLLRGAMTRPNLMQPGSTQRKTLATSGYKPPGGSLSRGPMKATAPVKVPVFDTPASVKAENKLTLRTSGGRGASPRSTTTTPLHKSAPGSSSIRGRLSMTSAQGPDKPVEGVTTRVTEGVTTHVTEGVTTRVMAQLNTSVRTLSADSNTSTPGHMKTVSRLSTPVSTKRRSYLPSPAKNTSFSSNRSLRSSTSSTDSMMETSVSDVSMNKSINAGSVPRRSLVAPTDPHNEKIRREMKSPFVRRSLRSPVSHLASKLKPLHLLDKTHKQKT